LIRHLSGEVAVIAKNREATSNLENIESIVRSADGIMVASRRPALENPGGRSAIPTKRIIQPL